MHNVKFKTDTVIEEFNTIFFYCYGIKHDIFFSFQVLLAHISRRQRKRKILVSSADFLQ